MKKILLVSMIVFVIWYRNSWALHLTSNGEATWQQTGKKYLWSGLIFSQNYNPDFCVHGRLPHTKGRMTFVNYSRMCFCPSELKYRAVRISSREAMWMVSCATEGNIEELMAFNPCSMLSEPKKSWRIRPQLDSNLQIGSSGAILVGFLISCKQVRRRGFACLLAWAPTQIDVFRPIQTCHFNF